jgi:iron complex outermembrane receptor protein
MTRFGLMLSSAIGAILLQSNAAFAEPADDAVDDQPMMAMDVVIVTAEKRAQRLQDIPISISAYGADTLDRANADSVADLQYLAPSLQFANVDGSALISIRGIGTTVLVTGEDPGIAVHLDGVYLARPQYHDAALFDVERVEVLRGPQGTVNGRNATGGSINIITQRPSEESGGYVNVGLGNYNAVTTDGAFGGALSGDNLLGRFAWRTNNHEGYTPNLLDGSKLDEANQQSVRGQVLARLSDRTELLLSVDADSIDTAGYANIVLGTITGLPLPGVDLGGDVATGRAVLANEPAYYRRDILGGSAQLKVDLDGMNLTATTGYRQFTERAAADLDGTSFDFAHERHSREQWQASQELNLTSDNDSDFSWLLGAFYLHESLENDEKYTFPSMGFNFSLGGAPTVNSYAVYAQGNYKLSDKFDVTAGLRYTRDEKKTSEFNRVPEFAVDVSDNLSGEWGAFTPKLSLNYKATEDSLIYASVSRGFRSGGFNIGGFQGESFAPEFIMSYEAGYKQQLFDKRLTANLALFRSEYTDMQVFQIRGFTATVENAASATLQGAELELTALLGDGYRFDVAASYIDSEFNELSTIDESRASLGELDLSGNQLARAPKAKLNISAEKQWDTRNGGSIRVRGDYAWTDRVYFSEFNLEEMSQPSVTVLNANISYETPDGRYTVSAFAQNLADEQIYTNKLVGAGSLGFDILSWSAAPRTYGIKLGARF